MAKPAEVGEEVSVRRSRVEMPTAEGPPEALLYITYSTKDLPPGLVIIPEKEWSEAKEKERIKQDLEERRKLKPVTVRL